VVTTNRCEHAEPIVVVVGDPINSTCPTSTMHRVGPRRPRGRVYFKDFLDTGPCTADADPFGADSFELGERVDPASLFPLFPPTAL
jgi:hypothetical protein